MRLAFLLAVGCATAQPPMARVELRCPDPEADVSIDGAPAGKVKDYAKQRLSLRAGKHRIEVRSAGRVQQREFELGPGDQIALSLGGGDT